MAVNPTPPLPKSQPDISKLNTFTGYVVTVTKHLGPRNTVGTSVVASQAMQLKEILDLQVSLPLRSPPAGGPGFYMFNVSDAGGTGDDSWMVKLGPDLPQENYQMPGLPGQPGSAPPPPDAEGNINIGNGYYYNKTLGLLTTPWRKAYNWTPGDPIPDPPPTPALNAPASFLPPGGVPGWGTFPVNDDSRALKEMEARMAEERRQRERDEDNRRREQEREDRRRDQEEQRRRDDARDAQMTKLFETLFAKPTGPSETELLLRREVEETKRRLEEQQREDLRRREDQAREDRHRAEQKAQQEKTDALIREMRERDSHRPDPLLSLMTTVLTSTQGQATESVRAVREAATLSTQAAERHTQQMLEAVRQDKTGAAEMTKMVLEGTRSVMDMQQGVYQQMLEVANSGGGPWYASAIQELAGKIGTALPAIAAARQQQPVQPQTVIRQPPAARVVAPGTTRPIPQVSSPPPVAGLPASVSTGDRPAGVQYDGASDTFIVPGGEGHPGYRVPSKFVQEHGWTATLQKLAQESAPSPVAAFAGVAAPPGAPPALTIVPPHVEPTAMNGAAPAPTKRGRGRKNQQQPPAPPVGPAIPQPSNPQGYSREEMQAFDHETMTAIMAPFPDDLLFGADIWPYVQQLRADPPDPVKVAELVLQAKAQLTAAGKGSAAMDLLDAAQIDVFVERLLPGLDDAYQEAVAKALAEGLGLTVLEEAES